jgi:selenoprotein W-related protein
MSTTNVEIQYCVPCGHLNRAIDIQKSLLEHFGQKLASVRLKTGDSGIFEIRVGDDKIYDKADPFDLEALIGSIEERL